MDSEIDSKGDNAEMRTFSLFIRIGENEIVIIYLQEILVCLRRYSSKERLPYFSYRGKLSVAKGENMECCDIVRNFLEGRKGKQIKVLVEGGKFQPVSGKLIDFNESAIVLEQKDGNQFLFDIDNVISVADVDEGKGEEG